MIPIGCYTSGELHPFAGTITLCVIFTACWCAWVIWRLFQQDKP